MSAKPPQHTIKLFFALLVTIAVSAWFVFGLTSTYWVGTATLTIEFCVTDAKTGSPIPNAQIEVRLLDRGPDPMHGAHAFTLTTDQQGRAIRTGQVSHSGNEAPFGFGNGQAAGVPSWGALATAERFEAGKMVAIFNLEAMTTGPAAYRIDVPISLMPQRLQ